MVMLSSNEVTLLGLVFTDAVHMTPSPATRAVDILVNTWDLLCYRFDITSLPPSPSVIHPSSVDTFQTASTMAPFLLLKFLATTAPLVFAAPQVIGSVNERPDLPNANEQRPPSGDVNFKLCTDVDFGGRCDIIGGEAGVCSTFVFVCNPSLDTDANVVKAPDTITQLYEWNDVYGGGVVSGSPDDEITCWQYE